LPNEHTDTEPTEAPPTDREALEAAKAAATGLSGAGLRALRAWIDARLVASDESAVGTELSDREAEALRLIALGYSSKEIAAQFKVSVKTVETYKARALEKLHIKSRVDIVRYAIRRGWIGADPTG
jgi:DNA-binding CsgD family transcriptional regulator